MWPSFEDMKDTILFIFFDFLYHSAEWKDGTRSPKFTNLQLVEKNATRLKMLSSGKVQNINMKDTFVF